MAVPRDCAIHGRTIDLRPVVGSCFGAGVPSCGAVLLAQSFAAGTMKLLSAESTNRQSSRNPSTRNLTVPDDTLTVAFVELVRATSTTAPPFDEAHTRYDVAFAIGLQEMLTGEDVVAPFA